MAIVPDFDFLPGLLVGQPTLYHQGISHSLSVAVTASFGLALLYSLKRGTMVADWARFFFAYASHLAIDLCGADTHPPYGIPVFWPLDGTSYLAPWEIFVGVHHVHGTAVSAGEWFATLLHRANFRAVGLEVFLMFPVILMVRYLSKLSRNCGIQ
jgi:membrane-bound metal-dependent hydrolase YbcI (DUF457 family)